MRTTDAFTAYQDLIKLGCFDDKYCELEGVLQVLQDAFRINSEQRLQLLDLARSKHVKATSPLER